MNESELTRDCVRRLNTVPLCYAFRVHGGPHQRKGTLDITGCYEGAFFSIEMKMPGKERNVTPIQRAMIARLRACGALVGVATNLKECLDIIGIEPEEVGRLARISEAS
jgi:hypothetical protein